MGFKSGKVQVPLEMTDKQVRILPAGAGRLCNSEATEMKNSMVLFANHTVYKCWKQNVTVFWLPFFNFCNH